MEFKDVTRVCPYCGKIGEDCENLLVKKVRGASVLMVCENLHIFGRGT